MCVSFQAVAESCCAGTAFGNVPEHRLGPPISLRHCHRAPNATQLWICASFKRTQWHVMASLPESLHEAVPAPSHELAGRISELGEWFHNLDLHGVPTAPHHFLGDFPNIKWRQIAPAIPEDLTGATVLDVGCNGGFYCIEMKRRGAKRVLGIDVDERYLRQARFASDTLGVEIELQKC